MLPVIATVLGIVNGDSRTFTPQIPEGEANEYHTERIWVHANTKCFETESDVREFADFLMTEYDCIDFQEPRRGKIYQQPGVGYDFWSLWFKTNDDHKCLSKNVTLPNQLLSECVANVLYEPLQHTQACDTQSTGNELWAVDIMDRNLNLRYEHRDFITTPRDVETMIIDTMVDQYHIEFSGLRATDLTVGPLDSRTSYTHGTHVCGSVVGHDVGTAKGRNAKGPTDFFWCAACQLGSSCAWNDIEDCYEACIDQMEDDQNTIYVINYSVGGSRTSFNEAIYDEWGKRIEDAGGFWVTSAGNSQRDACTFAPAFSEYAITVGSYDNLQTPSWFTNYGECVDTWGPGSNVYSALPEGGYGYMSGTSMASPNVCGAVVNLLKEDSSRTLSAVKEHLVEYSEPLQNVPVGWQGVNRRCYWSGGCDQ